jgi:hypothetical protein
LGLLLLCLGGISQADDEKPYAYITVEQEKVDLGVMFMWDVEIPEALVLKIKANTLHGPVIASVTPLKHKLFSNQINTDRIFIKTSYTGEFISMVKPVIIAGTDFGSEDISIDFKVKANSIRDIHGTYTGKLTFTFMPPV